MQSSLLLSDTKKFIDKYTRFMTKDIYISSQMNQDFLDRYSYLKEELEKNKYLYQEQNDYKNLFRIYRHNSEMLKLHNDKYLNKNISCYEDFFLKLYPKDILNKNKRKLIIANEDRMVSVVRKNDIALLISKIKYMQEYLHKNLSKIQILVCDDSRIKELKKELCIYELEDVSLCSLEDSYHSSINKGEVLLDKNTLYNELLHYIIDDLYSDKKTFSRFYEAFSLDIYLNRDYKDFDTFRDYHYYMYKRMFLDSGLSLDKFIKRETKKRRGQLRSIDNVFVDDRYMVDVANFLYLNSIEYQYKDDYFILDKNIITFNKDYTNKKYDVIYLDRDSNYLEVLIYELIKRQYGMEKRNDDDIYHMLFSTSIDCYFSDVIRNIFIPGIYYYQKNQDFNHTKFSKEQREVLKKFYEYYLEYKKNHHMLDDMDLFDRVQKVLDSHTCDYYVILGNCPYQIHKNYYMILDDYPKFDFMKDNMRFLYSYKSYLNEKKSLAMEHTYSSLEELSGLSSMFFKEHLNYLNKKMKENEKPINIYFYDEDNRVMVNHHLNNIVYDIVKNEKNKNIVLGLQSKREMKRLVMDDYFSKISSSLLHSEFGNVFCYDIYHMNEKYDILILPFLIKDQFHEDVFSADLDYQVKMGLYMAIGHCREKIYLLCPNSKREKYIKMFSSLSCIGYNSLTFS